MINNSKLVEIGKSLTKEMIRTALVTDIPRLVELGKSMHAESRYKSLRFNEKKVFMMFENLISGGGCLLVAEKNGEIVGGFAGYANAHYFSDDVVASDIALFILPEHRGGLTAFRLIKAFCAWAKFRGAAMTFIGTTTGVNPEKTAKLFELCDFAPAGGVYVYRG